MTKTIEQFLDEIDRARAKATQGEFFIDRLSSKEADIKNNPRTAWFKVMNLKNLKQTECDAEFLTIAANRITQLTKALRSSCEALESIKNRKSDTNGAYSMRCEKTARQTLTEIEALFEGKEKTTKETK